MAANKSFNSEYQEKNLNCQTWIDLFKLVIQKTKEQIHCGTLAKFKEIERHFEDGYGIAVFNPFPLTTDQQNFDLKAYYFKKETEDIFEADKENSNIYCIIFMDNNFFASLSSGIITKTSDTDLHSLSYGIVIDTM